MKWWILWFLSIPLFLISYLYSFFIESKIAFWSQEECKPEFIFTPKDVGYCSDIYTIDVVLIALKNNPVSYVCIILGLYIIVFLVCQAVKLVRYVRNKWL
ncbi:DUF4306 domain-containing protein [Gracilibacillus salinarum]|uniref:DUF4306 domain-containing protein n=1 Tax=Gracilibacillus salinarum TaxID=2932255 RepID=A0ABY4GH36_9BACI|nr:DUF4306 domain-containing protein [Gracilibacillus salinarum]UOQ83459.1 hypothetical protein MUN87_11870 [Gracilibacillus salinarum]